MKCVGSGNLANFDPHPNENQCARWAAAQTDPAVQQSFLDARKSWLKLVRRLAAAPERERN
jgi:hypothetical protein